MPIRELACVAHVHSTYSDGTATVPELIADARVAGVDALLLTDHDSLQARRDGWEGWHDGVLVVVGHEVSGPEGHLLVFGAEAEIERGARSEAEVCAAVAAAGAVGIAAHPFSRGSRISTRIGRPHAWSTHGTPGCAGIELWSLGTDTAESWRGPREALRTLRRPEAIDGPPARHLALWDELCREEPTVAIGGLDAHQPGLRVRGRVRSPMRNRRWFELLRTHVLVDADGDREPAADAVVDALRGGRCFLALVQHGDPTGFRFTAGDVKMGAEAAWEQGRRLAVELPAPADIVLLRDGEPVRRRAGRRLEHEADGPGVYRVEARRGGRTWIVSNPIYLR